MHHRLGRAVPVLLLAVTAPLATALLTTAPAAHADTAAVDAYLRQAAARVRTPGLYVDPQVYRDHRLTRAQADTIRSQARRQPSQVHLWVIPAARVSVGGHLAYPPRAIITRMHRLVGSPGTYAVLTEAATKAAGQSFYAYQWPGSGPVYRTGHAARDAISCCAPDYAGMLRRFVAESAVRRTQGGGPPLHPGHHRRHLGLVADPSSTGIGPGGVLAILLLLAAGGAALAFLLRLGRSGSAAAPPPDVGELRRPLTEEIEEVRQQISVADTLSTVSPTAATPPSGDDPVAARIASARAALDRAHTRLTTMSAPADAQAVTAALADARFELAAATALREGRPVPPRTPPCFVDPRHGPSTTTRLYPPSGLTSPVPVCAACDASLAAGTAPVARSFMLGGSRSFAWTPYGPAWWYLMGYWGQQPFVGDLPHHRVYLGGGDLHPARHEGPPAGGGGFFGGGGGGGHHGGFGGGGGAGGAHHGGFAGGHGGGGGFGGGGHHGGGGGGGHHG